MVLVSDGDRMVMLLVGDGDWMVLVLVGHADRMVMVLVGDGDRMVTVLVTWRLPGGNSVSVPRTCAFLFKSERVSVLLSFISLLSNYQNHRIVHFKRAWGNCLVVRQLLSTSVCHSFQKSGSPVGFVVSACLQRLFGGLWLFRLSF